MIIRTPRRVWICRILLVLNLLFIWVNSLLPGHVSGFFSNWLRDILATIFDWDEGGTGGGILRKIAHFLEFASLGVLMSLYVRMICKSKFAHILLPFVCSFAAACVDETIQMFVPARGPSIADVGIDSCGAIVGIIVFCGVYYLIKRSIIRSEE